jgi:hypothetical protein
MKSPHPEDFPSYYCQIVVLAFEEDFEIHLSSNDSAKRVMADFQAYRKSLIRFYEDDPRLALMSLGLSLRVKGKRLYIEPSLSDKEGLLPEPNTPPNKDNEHDITPRGELVPRLSR